jgi:hypothetical protein
MGRAEPEAMGFVITQPNPRYFQGLRPVAFRPTLSGGLPLTSGLLQTWWRRFCPFASDHKSPIGNRGEKL